MHAQHARDVAFNPTAWPRPQIADMTRIDSVANIPPGVLRSVISFLRDWLPPEARVVYRQMIAEDPHHWHRHPHFAGGVIAEHALRGNGITEKVLGVRDIEEVWPALLELALRED
jgi:hypothetical protein